MRKNHYIILLSYAFSVIYSIKQDSPSAFLFLTGLLMEMLMLFLIYIFITFKTPSLTAKLNSISIAVMSMPLLLFHYFIAWALTSKNGDVTKDFTNYGFFYPFKGLYAPFLIMTIGLLIDYYRDLKKFLTDKDPLFISEYSLFKNLIKLWVVGLVGITYYLLKLNEHTKIIETEAVLYMLVARIAVELIAGWNKKKADEPAQ